MSATPDGEQEPQPHHPESLVPARVPDMQGEPGSRRINPYPDKDPAPQFSTHTTDYTYKQWKRDVTLWRSATRWTREQQGASMLRQLRGEARAASG